VSDYSLADRETGVRSPAENFPVACVSRQLWNPPTLLSSGYRESFPLGVKSCRGVTLSTHPHLVPR